MVKLKFKARRKLGTVNFLGRPSPHSSVRLSRPLRFKTKPNRFKTKHTAPAFGSFLSIPKVRSVSIFSRGINRPAASFYGDSDGDGVMNGFDCAPFNPRKQGPEHVRRLKEIREDYEDTKHKVLQSALKGSHRFSRGWNEAGPKNEVAKLLKLDNKIARTQAIINKDTQFYGAEDFLKGHKDFIETRYGGALGKAKSELDMHKSATEEISKWNRDHQYTDDANQRRAGELLERENKVKEEEERFERIKKETNEDLDYYKKGRQEIEDRKIRLATRKIFPKMDNGDDYWEPESQKIEGTKFSIPNDSELRVPIKDED